MALVVEDGTGLTNAESYVSTTELSAYATKWGLKGFSNVTGDNEVILRKATRAIDLMYGFIGEPLTSTQALQWPRKSNEDYTSVPSGVPGDIKDATCEMAYVYLSQDPLAPLAAGEVGLVELTKEVGDLKTTKKWEDGSYSPAALNSTRKVQFILQDLVDDAPGGFMVGVVRG